MKGKIMKRYIFITTEGCTYLPDSESIEPNCENSQVVGYANGENEEDAFNNLLKENDYLKDTKFDELICYQITPETRKKFYIGDKCK